MESRPRAAKPAMLPKVRLDPARTTSGLGALTAQSFNDSWLAGTGFGKRRKSRYRVLNNGRRILPLHGAAARTLRVFPAEGASLGGKNRFFAHHHADIRTPFPVLN